MQNWIHPLLNIAFDAVVCPLGRGSDVDIEMLCRIKWMGIIVQNP
jgi:hypothetical protein